MGKIRFFTLFDICTTNCLFKILRGQKVFLLYLGICSNACLWVLCSVMYHQHYSYKCFKFKIVNIYFLCIIWILFPYKWKNLVKQSLKSKKILCIYIENVTGINYTPVNLTIFLVSAVEWGWGKLCFFVVEKMGHIISVELSIFAVQWWRM